MSYTNDVPWPGSSSGSISHLDGSSYFSPSSSTVNVLDHSTLAPNQSSQYASAGSAGAGGTTFRVVSGSELPDARQRRASAHARAPSSPNASTAIYSPSRSKKLTPSGAEDSDASGNPVLRVRPGPIPLTSSSTIVKSTAPGFVRPEEVWKEILKTAYGRDKALKIMQYSMRVVVLSHSRSSFLMRTARVGELVRRLKLAIGHLSITRKSLILFNWLTPLIHILSPSDTSIPYASKSSSSVATLSSPTLLHRFLHAPPPVLLDLLNAIADDVATFSHLGLIGPRIGERASRWADRFWFGSTLAGLVEVGAERAMVKGIVRELEQRIYDAELDKTADLSKIDEHEKELARLKSQYGWLQVTRVKLLMDLVFVSYDLFKIRRGKDSAKTFTGLGSALLSTWKMYDSQRAEILKSNA